mmetsp:Transcript_52542/g.167073  ORF Transcript_52542/g.167073 Transcript_52542/m.167073 type:complete len:206 (+) Transcript_52542:3-620(+)
MIDGRNGPHRTSTTRRHAHVCPGPAKSTRLSPARSQQKMRGMPIRSFVLAVAVSALCIGGALGQKQPTRESMDDDVKQSYDGECAPGCKPAFVGDQNCDEECNHEWCDFDGGDCESEWKLRRMIVMGAFYTSVDSVEYQLEGPRGEIKKLTMEEGRRMEGIDEASSEIVCPRAPAPRPHLPAVVADCCARPRCCAGDGLAGHAVE